MRVKLFIALFLWHCVQAVATVPPQLQREWATASAFLSQNGVRAHEVEVVYESPQCVFFAAPADSSFVLLTREAYRPLLDSPVLAYGTDNDVWRRRPDESDPDEQDGFFIRMIHLYEATLQEMEASGKQPLKLSPAADAGPFCADIYYGQHLPYNKLFPMDGYGDDAWYSVVGCGPVALGQVLTFHHSPVQPKGVYSGHTLSGNSYTYNLADYPVDWDHLRPEVLLLDCAISLGTQLGVGYSLTMLPQFKAALFDAWSYSPRCKMLTSILKEEEMVGKVREELEAGRPVILAGGHHLYVCDGLKGDFLHLDFGWKGFGNGYFRTLLLSSEKGEWQLPFHEALIGIEPDNHHDYKDVTVKLSKGGTLKDKLPEKDRPFIRKLTIKGPVNGEDMDLIRLMAGAVIVPSDYRNQYGALSELDLSQARIVQTGPFRIRTQTPLRGTIKPYNKPAFDYNFDPETFTDQDWEQMVSLGLDAQLSQEWKDGVLFTKYPTPDDVIPTYMFADCVSLTKVILPKKLIRVAAFAFFNCKGLRVVENLPKNVDPQAFLTSLYSPAE